MERLCDVQVGKQIDGGIGFVDVSDFCDESLDPDPGEGLCAGGPDQGDPCDPTAANACRTIEQAVGWDGEPVNFKLIVKNTGEARVRCTVTDNKISDPIIPEVVIPPGQMEMVTIDATCSGALEPSDTATLSCECLDDQDVATGDTIGDMDTVELACQTPDLEIAKLPQFLAAIEDADLVLGSRYLQGRVTVVNWPMPRLVLSYCANIYARVVTGLRLWDATGGFKCFRRRVLEAVDLDQVGSNGYAFQIEVSFRAARKGFRIVEIPVVFVDRTDGTSKMSGAIVREAVWMVWWLRLQAILRRI